MQLVVLAGGFGTRLRGAIPDGIPKPMASIAGKPFLAHLFDRAIIHGVDRFHLLVGYGADVIINHFGKNYRGIAVTYSLEEKPLGTGGALKAAAPSLSDRFILANGDTFAEVPYLELFELLDANSLAMSLAEVDDAHRYGSVVVEEGAVVKFHEKGASGAGLINAGVYACRKSVLDKLPERTTFSFEVDFLQTALPEIRPSFLRIDSDIIDIGTPESYGLANTVFTDRA